MKAERHVPVVPATAVWAEEKLRENYRRDGVCALAPLISADLVVRASAAMDDIIGRDSPPTSLVKSDQPHWTNETMRELVTDPTLARWAAALVDASLLQVFAVQLLYKPSDAPGQEANVGWHQDDSYWEQWWTGEAFTAWIALSDVPVDSGPVHFVQGSHRWGNIGVGDFFDRDLDSGRFQAPHGEPWTEMAAVLPPGGVSFHSRFTIHGSSTNTSGCARRGVAVHMRSERASPVAGVGYDSYRNADLELSPIVFDTLRS